MDVQSQKWAVGYLRGRITGYQKGHVPLKSVASAARIARDSDVPLPEIVSLLQTAGLSFDGTTHTLKVDSATQR